MTQLLLKLTFMPMEFSMSKKEGIRAQACLQFLKQSMMSSTYGTCITVLNCIVKMENIGFVELVGGNVDN